MGFRTGFALMPDNTPSEPEDARKARWRTRDVGRAIDAAEKAGLSRYRVEIAPDGTISIVVGMPSNTAPDPEAPGHPQQL